MRQAVISEMTLQMQHAQAIDRSEDVGPDWVELLFALLERIEIIVQRRGIQMDRNALVPVGKVQGEPVRRDGHGETSTTNPPVAGSAPPSILPSTIRIACTQAKV